MVSTQAPNEHSLPLGLSELEINPQLPTFQDTYVENRSEELVTGALSLDMPFAPPEIPKL